MIELFVDLSGVGQLVKDVGFFPFVVPVNIGVGALSPAIDPGNELRGVFAVIRTGARHLDINRTGGGIGVEIEHGKLGLITEGAQ